MSTKKAEARERVKAMREEQARKDRARERTMRLGIAAAVLVGVAIIAIAVISSRGGDEDGTVAVPENASQVEGDNGIVVGDADAPVTIENWMDFRCPHCQTFEQANGAQIDQWVEAGEARVIYHPVTYTGGVQSTRANNALACAADEGMAKEFISEAFARFQAWSNNQLVSLGDDIGIGGDYASCVRDGTYDAWSTSVTDSAREAQIGGTPTIFVNGELVDNPTPDMLAAAVEAAASGEPADEGASEEDGAEDEEAADEGSGAEENTDEEDTGADED
ncbi:thioredoxin domain-containing protein [Phytoactinopolyspora alkaliphila]|uniref:Thioredoxin domain-containing protein n=1 Tax=Phytoactinopolyspora alkaliphila TaxID=1783498 RepID=A0A6N9YG23_9ACTN|nr:thioredoxin domain-containing protein [Phytoactinopolyspora alkaliphila]NED93865.1 thioredoxin domain-containing protein [Phytoactinopolyspora alkaliphila]